MIILMSLMGRGKNGIILINIHNTKLLKLVYRGYQDDRISIEDGRQERYPLFVGSCLPCDLVGVYVIYCSGRRILELIPYLDYTTNTLIDKL